MQIKSPKASPCVRTLALPHNMVPATVHLPVVCLSVSAGLVQTAREQTHVQYHSVLNIRTVSLLMSIHRSSLYSGQHSEHNGSRARNARPNSTRTSCNSPFPLGIRYDLVCTMTQRTCRNGGLRGIALEACNCCCAAHRLAQHSRTAAARLLLSSLGG